MRIAGCTAAACRVAERCGIRFEAGPRTVLCKARLGLDDLPADFDLTPYCVEGCRAMGGGEIAACLEAKAECVAGDVIAPEDFGCAGSTEAPEREPECAETCDGAKRECDYACPITSLRACMDCSAGCGAAWHACLQRC